MDSESSPIANDDDNSTDIHSSDVVAYLDLQDLLARFDFVTGIGAGRSCAVVVCERHICLGSY